MLARAFCILLANNLFLHSFCADFRANRKFWGNWPMQVSWALTDLHRSQNLTMDIDLNLSKKTSKSFPQHVQEGIINRITFQINSCGHLWHWHMSFLLTQPKTCIDMHVDVTHLPHYPALYYSNIVIFALVVNMQKLCQCIQNIIENFILHTLKNHYLHYHKRYCL